MIFIWLLVWLIYNTPPVEFWNNWAIALAVCLLIDILNLDN